MIQLLTGDCRAVLPTLPANSVHCVVSSPPYYALRSYLDADHPDKASEIGLEATPDAFIAEMVAVFRLIRRVLRDDGTVWLNLGDSYNSQNGFHRGAKYMDGGAPRVTEYPSNRSGWDHLAPKQLLLMPARVALALQADGWWVRSDIIWAKPNPMPESCRDRPTSAHEHVFLLSKRSRYFYDSAAVAEPATNGERFHGGYDGGGPNERTSTNNGRDRQDNATATRSLRNVWTIATHPYSAAHFATFPPTLAERCIRAGTSERGCCAACGAPWTRVVERSVSLLQETNNERSCDQNNRGAMPRANVQNTTTGWRPSCKCAVRCITCEGTGYAKPATCFTFGNECQGCKGNGWIKETVPATVLDPFSGAGTTALVADRLGRNAIGIDLSHQYVEMARERLVADCPLFAELSPPPPLEDAYDQPMRDLFAPLAAD